MIERIKKYLYRKELEAELKLINQELATTARGQMLLLKNWNSYVMTGETDLYYKFYAANDAQLEELKDKRLSIQKRLEQL